MEDARQRHRRSIARAVQGLDEQPQFAQPTMDATAQEFTPQKSCNMMGDGQMQCSNWSQANSFDQCGTPEVWHGQSMEWNCPSSSTQARIGQAISSAYNCYEQGYSNG